MNHGPYKLSVSFFALLYLHFCFRHKRKVGYVNFDSSSSSNEQDASSKSTQQLKISSSSNITNLQSFAVFQTVQSIDRMILNAMMVVNKVWCFVVLIGFLKCVVAVGESQTTTRQRYAGHNANTVNQNDYISKIYGTVAGLQSSNHEINQKLDEIDDK